MSQLIVKTQKPYELVEITPQVQSLLKQSVIRSGLLIVSTPHTTAAIICNENESRLKSDILKVARALKEHAGFFGGFEHDVDEGNAAAHIISVFAGNARIFPVADGKLQLGSWQSIMLLEMDGPRTRTIMVNIIPD